MGKKLIIKGADFSANAIEVEPTPSADVIYNYDDLTWVQGKFINSTTGSPINDASWQYHERVDLRGFNSLTFKAYKTGSTAGYKFTDLNGNYLSGDKESTLTQDKTIPIPTGASYFMCSAYKTTDAGWQGYTLTLHR